MFSPLRLRYFEGEIIGNKNDVSAAMKQDEEELLKTLSRESTIRSHPTPSTKHTNETFSFRFHRY